jgi:hypothetical protein
MLFVLAWSSVAFNLGEVYQPVMKLVFGLRSMDDFPKLASPLESPRIDWREAHVIGQKRMREASETHGFTIQREDSLVLERDHGLYVYTVRRTADMGRRSGTGATFDANTGALKSVDWPGSEGEKLGDAITRWLIRLHIAAVFGLPMQGFLCAMGLVITLIAVTGVVIWLQKRKARAVAARRRAARPSQDASGIEA